MSTIRFALVTGIAITLMYPVRGMCDQPQKQMTAAEMIAALSKLPPGTPVEYENTVTTTQGGSVKETENARGVGASGTATGDQSKLGIDGSAPGASLSGGGNATGGSVSATGESKINASLFGNPLVWAGIFCWLGAGAAVYLRLPIRVAIIAACAGAAFICAALYPGVMLFLVAGASIAGIGLYIWSETRADKGEKAKEALRAVVAGISNATPTAAEMVKAEVAKQATETDKATIKAIKREDGLA